jgi:hypothetical protein
MRIVLIDKYPDNGFFNRLFLATDLWMPEVAIGNRPPPVLSDHKVTADDV